LEVSTYFVYSFILLIYRNKSAREWVNFTLLHVIPEIPHLLNTGGY
jgi:hypothetical protein